jgi:hypothetical protein
MTLISIREPAPRRRRAGCAQAAAVHELNAKATVVENGKPSAAARDGSGAGRMNAPSPFTMGGIVTLPVCHPLMRGFEVPSVIECKTQGI